VRWRDTPTNRLVTTDADWVILADGKGAMLPPSPPPTGDLGIKAHFEGVDGPRDAIELFAGPGCYGGLAPVNGNRWNGAFGVPTAAVRRAGGDVSAVFAAIVRFNPRLAGRLSTARVVGRWLAAPLPRFAVAARWPHRVVPVGNAAAALEPIGGEGMGLALRSAELAVAEITRSATERHMNRPPLPQQYGRLWRTRRAACRGMARAVADPNLADTLAALLWENDRLTAAAMRWAGKAQA